MNVLGGILGLVALLGVVNVLNVLRVLLRIVGSLPVGVGVDLRSVIVLMNVVLAPGIAVDVLGITFGLLGIDLALVFVDLTL